MNVEWDIRGWKRLTVHNDPPLVGAREEFMTWVLEVPKLHRTDLDSRLKSELEHPHFSARLELFIHHYFASNGWNIQIHPKLPVSKNRPDFLVEHENEQILVECKTIFDKPEIGQQEQRLRQLATDVGRRLSVSVMLEPLGDLPPSLPASHIRNEIEQRVRGFPVTHMIELDIRGTHQGISYALRAIVFPVADEHDPLVGVQGLMSDVQTVTNGEQLRERLREKAGKYGELHHPFLIAVSAETTFPMRSEHEMEALFGDTLWNQQRSGQFAVSRTPNGLYMMTRDGDARYARVSAVLVYRFKWLENDHEHRIHLYHNPYASKPIDTKLFSDIPQLVRLDDGTMRWINGEPEPY